MSYKSRRYREGLSGKRPGWIQLDEKGHRAQEAGYRDHLRNKDLAERIARAHADRNDSYASSDNDTYTPEPPKPARFHHRVTSFLFGVAMICLAVFLSMSIASASTETDHSPYWWSFIIGLAVTSILWYPGAKAIRNACKPDLMV